jgi:nitroreductase
MNKTVWDIRANEYPQDATIEEKINFWLRYAILAPSAHNTQPWRWEIRDSIIEIYRDEKHTLRVSDPTLRETFLSLGAFIENFIIAARNWNYEVAIDESAFKVSDAIVARLVIKSAVEIYTNSQLFSAIVNRHTNRGFYNSDPLPSVLLEQFAATSEPGIKTFIITDNNKRQQISELVGKGVYIALSMSSMREELADIVYNEEENQETGMSIESMIEGTRPSSDIKNYILQDFDPKKESIYWYETFASTATHIIVATELDGPAAWLSAGRVMERLLLIAASHGLTHCIAAAPVEIPTLAPSLRTMIDSAYRPQVLLRVGMPLNRSFTKPQNRRNIR